MDTIEFLGITFRSIQHMNWFIFTVISLIIIVIINLLFLTPMRRSLSLQILGTYIFMLSGAIHLIALLTALIKTKGGVINGPITSVDCIWFNGVMFFVVLFFSLLSIRFYKRGKNWGYYIVK